MKRDDAVAFPTTFGGHFDMIEAMQRRGPEPLPDDDKALTPDDGMLTGHVEWLAGLGVRTRRDFRMAAAGHNRSLRPGVGLFGEIARALPFMRSPGGAP